MLDISLSKIMTLVIVALLAVGIYAFFFQKDTRTGAERVGDAVSELQDHTPAERMGDAVKGAVDGKGNTRNTQ